MNMLCLKNSKKGALLNFSRRDVFQRLHWIQVTQVSVLARSFRILVGVRAKSGHLISREQFTSVFSK